MKKIDTSNIVGTAKAPFIKPTHDHYKQTIQETTGAIITGLMGSYTTGNVIILWGCVFSGTDPGARTLTAGAIYYNGEIYQVPAASFTTTGSNIPLWTIATTYIGTDPIYWSDGVQRNTHQIDQFVLVSGPVGGSGITGYVCDYNSGVVKIIANLFNISINVATAIQVGDITATSINTGNIALKTKVVDITSWNMDTTATKSVAHGFTDITKIMSVKVIIRNDAGTIVSDVDSWGATGQPEAGINYIDVTNVAITRLNGSTYDAAAYNGSGTRGHIIFEYIS